MRSVLRLSLIGFGLMMAVGCVLPDRNLSRADRFDSTTKNAANSSADSASTSRLAFKSPLRADQTGSMQPALNPEQPDRGAGRNSTNLQAGYSVESGVIRPVTHANSIVTNRPGSTGGNLAGSSNDADSTIASPSRNDTNPASYVTLEGVEAVDPSASDFRSRADASAGIWSTNRDGQPREAASDAQFASVNPDIQNWSDRQAGNNDDPARQRVTGGAAERTLNMTAARSNPRPPPVDVPPLPPLPWQAELEKLIAIAEQDIAGMPLDRSPESRREFVRRQAQLRLLYLMSQRQEEALTAIPGLDPSEQEFWQQLVLAMSNSFDTNQFPDAGERAGQLVSPLSEALRQIRENAPLSIKNLGFCRKISYFGNYERFPRNEFTPGQEVLLYTEIENFTSSPMVDAEYRTSLKSLVEIVDQNGKVVWKKDFPPTEDLCRNPRRDYFHNYQFHIPKELSTGVYALKLTIEDEIGHKRSSNSLNFVLK